MYKRLIIILTAQLLLALTYANNRLIVFDKQLTLSASADEHFFIGLYEGDTAVISYEELNGKAIGSVEFYAYPSTLIYTSKNEKQRNNQLIPISKSGVYYVKIKNSALVKRSIELRLERIPKDEVTQEYSSKVRWKEVEDTNSISQLIEKVYEKEYQAQRIYEPKQFYLSAQELDQDNDDSKMLIPVQIPHNTVAWYYTFATARRASELRKAMHSHSLEAQLHNFIIMLDSIGNHEIALYPAKGTEYCDFFLLDQKQAINFLNGKQFDYYTSGSSLFGKSSVVDVYESEDGLRYVGVRNATEDYGIYFYIEVVAVVEIKRPITDIHSKKGVKRFKLVPFVEHQY